MPILAREISAVRLDRAPQVREILDRLGYGKLLDAVSYRGRNTNWAGRTTNGPAVFVKRFDGEEKNARLRLRRVAAANAVLDASQQADVRVPRLLGVDEDARIAVFARVSNAVSAHELAFEDRFTVEDAVKIGAIVGTVHALSVPNESDVDGTEFPMPQLDCFSRLTLEQFIAATAGTLDVWGMLHGDQELASGISRLRAWEANAPRRPCHGDFRLDQLLWADGGWYVTDWEDFRWGDPARDIGCFAGEWLHRAVLDIRAAEPDEIDSDSLSHEDILHRGVESIMKYRPFFTAFWRAYNNAAPHVDEQLAIRATAFAGWHLLDRVLAEAQRRGQISVYSRAVAGVGRSAVLTPERFTTVLGLTPAHADE